MEGGILRVLKNLWFLACENQRFSRCSKFRKEFWHTLVKDQRLHQIEDLVACHESPIRQHIN